MTKSMPTAVNSPPTLALLIALSWVNPVALNMTLPSMPTMAADLNAPYAMVQLSLSLFLVAIAVAQLILGPLSDRYGRRSVLIWGGALFVAASGLCAVAGSIEVLLAARILQAIGGCAGVVLVRAIVQDVYGRDRAASMLGYVTMGVAVAPMLAPLAGGYVGGWAGWRASFVCLAVAGAVVLMWTALRLRETARRDSYRAGRDIVRDFAQLCRQRAFWFYALVVALSNGVFFSFLGGAPLVAVEALGMTPQGYGLWFLVVAGGFILGNFLSGRWSHRLGIHWMIRVGVGLALAAVAAIAVFAGTLGLSPLLLFGPMFFSGLGNGLITPNGIAGAVSVRPDIAGAAAGLTGSIQIGLGAAASALVGVVIDAGNGPVHTNALVIVMLGLATLAFFLGMARPTKPLATPA